MPGDERRVIGGSLMAQYLLAMLSQRTGREGPGGPGGGFNLSGGPDDGRWGDYVFNQEGRQSAWLL
jgi:E3 ubiquitin-protein ligase RNF115/126